MGNGNWGLIKFKIFETAKSLVIFKLIISFNKHILLVFSKKLINLFLFKNSNNIL